MLSRVFRGRAAYQLRSLSTAYTYAGTGDPAKVISRSSIKPLSAPASNEINVNWLAAGVDPVDLAALSGSPSATAYTNTSFPAVPGNEGVAVVIAVGPSVKGIAEGDHVIPIKTGLGTWSESSTVNGSHVIPVPKMRLELAATMSTSPFMAIRLLTDFVKLSPGDVILQNAGEGPVACAIAQIANAMGLRTVTLVTSASSHYAPTVERLKLYGSEIVVAEQYCDTNGFKEAYADMPATKLVLNGGSIESCATLVDIAGSDATLVTYCPGVENHSACNAKGIESRSFSLPDWLENTSRTDVENMVATLAQHVQDGTLTAWLQRVDFEKLPNALLHGSKIERKFVAVMPSANK